MSKITVREAALLTGKSRETINNATKDGTLSFTHNGRNHKVIDIAELERVYPLQKSMDDIKKAAKTVKNSQPVSETDSQEWRDRYLEEKARADAAVSKIEVIEKYSRKTHDLMEEQADTLRKSLILAQEGHNRATMLLEDRTVEKDTGNEWKETFEKLEKRIANREEAADKKQKELEEALELEKAKSFIHRILGK
ncbi:MAG: hypothetical protein JKY93_12810 [Gammaproteobacteria bacterium]|nr:hypothetical protein [Gammaproteobacteria bacterium]